MSQGLPKIFRTPIHRTHHTVIFAIAQLSCCSRHSTLRTYGSAILVYLATWVNLLGYLLADNQIFQDTSDRMKFCGIVEWVGVDI